MNYYLLSVDALLLMIQKKKKPHKNKRRLITLPISRPKPPTKIGTTEHQLVIL